MIQAISICFNILLLISLAHSMCQNPTNTVNVNLTSCDLVELTPDYFGNTNSNNLSMVQSINLTDNQLESISNHTFIRVPKLLKLDLTENRISHLDKSAFEGLIMLKTLILNQNRLTIVDLDVFKPCIRLHTLNIENNFSNELQSQPNTTLSVKELSLGDNKFTNISGLSHMPHLKRLWLHINLNLSLPATTFIKNPLITSLDLSNTGLKVDNGFQFLTNIERLTKLCLDRNNLADFKLDTLPSLPYLTTLQIGSCNLTELDFELLKQKFPFLGKIYKAGNRFGCWHVREIEAYLEKNNIAVIVDKPTAYDKDDDIKCAINSFDTILILIIGGIAVVVLLVLFCIVRSLCARCSKKPTVRIDSIHAESIYSSKPIENRTSFEEY